MCTVIVKGSKVRLCFECPYFRNIRQKDGRVKAECLATTPREEKELAGKCPLT